METQSLPRSPGRPRGFDRDAALEAAMRLFWRHGYEGVSFQQLTTTLGVAAPSLYATFGNKETLYREALDRYVKLRVAPDLSFIPEDLSLEEAMRFLLHATARGLAGPGCEIGCMLNTGMITSHPDHASLAQEVADRRTALRAMLTTELQAWVDPDRAGGLARFITAMMQGMAIQACDGATTLELLALADQAVSCLGGLGPHARMKKDPCDEA